MKVFLSSTGRDLKAYRDAAFDAIQRLGLHCVRMEDFRGPGTKIEDFDDRRVADCELFVIILGHLHGTCPERNEKSYTELEYEAAVKYQKTCFLFLAPEDFAFPASLIESDDKRAKQRAFRDHAVKGVIRQTFTSPDDLAAQIAQAIHVWRHSPDKPAKPGSFLPLPPQPYFAHPYPLQENFTGRLTERRMLTEWLTGERNVLSLVAMGGMGKSALTWAWLQRDVLGLPLPGVSKSDDDDCRVPDRDRPEGVLWWSFYENEASFATFVRDALRYASSGQADPKAYPSLFDQLKMLTTLLAQRRLLLMLDGFERELRAYAGLNAAYQGDDFREDADVRSCIDPRAGVLLQWVAAGPMRSRVLLTSRLHPRELDGLAGCEHKDLTALDPEDAVRFFQVQGVKGTRAEIQTACAPYGYHPLALRLLAGVIVRDRRNPGDISVAARHPVLAELKGKEKHHILQVAYDAMEALKRELLSRLAAFRSPMSHEALAALNQFPSEAEFDAAVDELIDRGLLLFDRGQGRYDLHPVVRQHAYDRLTDKAGVHTRLRDYFAKVPVPDGEKLESVDELAPVIELYHHTVRAGQYDEALKLYRDRHRNPLYFRFGAYQVCIELMRGVFPEGEDRPPRLETEGDRSYAQNELAISYSRSGQPRRAVPLLLLSNEIDGKAGDKKGLAIGLGNLANAQLSLGQPREAGQNLRREIELSRDIGYEFQEAVGHALLGRLEAYQGRSKESFSELDAALSSFRDKGRKQSEGLAWAYCALRALLTKDIKEAIKSAGRSRALARVERNERDIIQAEWLLGWALIETSPSEAEAHLSDALARCRRINLVESEPDILLAWARWHRAAGNATQARQHAEEALATADRCEYRLVQADVHNFLAQLALDAGYRDSARHHAEIGRERAWCDGPPHCYKPALEEAEQLLGEVGGTKS
jgi:tetratricopeptide (TPR) repeat protein